jgi:polar amino acid transport system substrate-binding protein
MRKEYVEVFGGGRSAALDDFKSAVLYSANGSVRNVSSKVQDKGQKAMLAAWLQGLRSGRPCVDQELLLLESLATVLCVESLCIGMPVEVGTELLDEQGAVES